LPVQFGFLLIALSLLAVPQGWAVGQVGSTPDAQQPAPTEKGTSSAQSQPGPPVAAQYTLTPEKRARAVAYSRARYILYFAGVVVSVAIYWLLWRSKLAALFRDWARKGSRRHFVQCLIFVPLFLAAVALLEFPLAYYSGFVVERRFDLSTQGFASWLGDWGKSFALTALLGIVLVWIFYWIVRRSPRRWWLYVWMISIPVVLVLILMEPYAVEPLFFRFTPLERNQAALTERVQEMLARARLKIPRTHILEMNASTKTRTLNAYVSGLGASKRVVVWDTALKKLEKDETLLLLGHEIGHYVLRHIPKGFVLWEMLFLVLSYLGFVAVDRIVERAGARTHVEGVGDLASFPVVLLVLTVLVFCASPLINGFSRYYERQADQFGLELAYGVVADPNAADVRGLQILGEEDLADPEPNPVIKFWLYSHPPLNERIRFAAGYKPWAEGKPLQLVRPKE